MPLQASTDRDLARTGSRQRQTGSRLLLIGGSAVALGLILILISSTTAIDFVGWVLLALGAVPAMAGIAALLAGLVSGRASQRKPFA